MPPDTVSLQTVIFWLYLALSQHLGSAGLSQTLTKYLCTARGVMAIPRLQVSQIWVQVLLWPYHLRYLGELRSWSVSFLLCKTEVRA